MVGEAVDVVDVGAEAAVAQLVQPAVFGHESEAVQHLHVADVQPEAGDVWRVAFEELRHFVQGGELVVVEAVLEAYGDTVGGGVLGDLGQGAASLGEVSNSAFETLNVGLAAQVIHLVAVADTGVE